jgi:hypothetical protein
MERHLWKNRRFRETAAERRKLPGRDLDAGVSLTCKSRKGEKAAGFLKGTPIKRFGTGRSDG